MSLPARAVTLFVAAAAVIAFGVFLIVQYILAKPATVNYASYAKNGQVNLYLQEDPQSTVGSRPDWVSYFIMKPNGNPSDRSSWVHTTLFQLPANTRVNVTLYGYDGCTPLRNNYFSQIQGTIGNKVSVQQFNKGTALGPAKNVSVINSWSTCSVGHTFAIPSLHLFVPAQSPGAAVFNKSPCGTSPCIPSDGSYALEKFSFMTPKKTGQYRWQCFVPCGGGFLDGNGGPMQTIGYMTGFMRVVA